MNKEEYDITIQRNNDITYELKYANENIAYISIHNKEYAEVKEKVKAFRAVFPEGSISTKVVEVDEEHCICKASIFNENGSLLAEGHAQENIATTKFKDSMLEIAETSAIGRALGVLGIGVKGGIDSAETMRRAADKEETKNNMLLCHRCNHPIIDTEDKSGKIWKAREISDITTKHYGDPLCFRCLREVKSEKTELEV